MVERAGNLIKLSQREYALLEYLMRNVGRTVTRTMVVEHVWNLWFDGLTSVVDVYISYLRAKIDHGFSVPLIHTVRGVGFIAFRRATKLEKREKLKTSRRSSSRLNARFNAFSIQQKRHRSLKIGTVGSNPIGL